MQKPVAALTLAAASLIALSGCSTSTSAQSSDSGTVHVVASTNVYGSLAAQVGGDRVTVTSLIDSVAKDPHSYDATARDRLAVQRAGLVIENGGGYDSFMTELLEGSDARVITAVELSDDFPADGAAPADDHAEDGADHAEDAAGHGHHDQAEGHEDHAEDAEDHGHEGHTHLEGVNEHVWFDVHTITRLVERIAGDLGELDPEGAADYAAAAASLTGELDGIRSDLDELHVAHEGERVFITEPLPGLLAAAAGLDDVAPQGFASAVEQGNDVAPATLLAALDTIEHGHVRAVLTTSQTAGSETTRIEEAAKAVGIPTVAFSELLEDDQSYAEWMRAAIDRLSAALER